MKGDSYGPLIRSEKALGLISENNIITLIYGNIQLDKHCNLYNPQYVCMQGNTFIHLVWLELDGGLPRSVLL